MTLFSLQNVKLAFGGAPLLDGVNLSIDLKERVCLVGRNGAGKSSLLKVIGGNLLPDSGEIICGQGMRIAFLPQEVPHNLSGTVFEVVSAGLPGLVDLLSQYRTAGKSLALKSDPCAFAELERLQHQIDCADGWQIQKKVDTVLSRLNLAAEAPVSELSGGYKRRVLLARALVNDPDLLLLDEPTNHLDISSIIWLESFLQNYSRAVLFTTHDRRFIQTLATRIVELDRGRLTDWPGDYANYVRRRQAELASEAAQNALFDKKLSQEEAWIRQGVKARRTRNEGRVRALREMRKERLARREQTGSVTVALNEAERSGKLVLEAKEINYKWDQNHIVRNFSTIILRGDKIGIIGPNGCGKTTLLGILLGSIKPLTGSLRRGTDLEIAYFDQHRMELIDDLTVVENVGDGSEQVTVNGKTRHIIGYLENFLFPPERSRSPVKALSGGERNRALLAKLFTKPFNVLVMDEPTNDLDSDTLDLLEELLMEYKGTVLVVSHDREFLNNVVTSTLVFEGDGKITEYVGGYDDWLLQRSSVSPEKCVKAGKVAKVRPQRERPRTLTFKEKQELEDLPLSIESLEAERDSLYQNLSDPEFYRQQGNRLVEVRKRFEELEREISAGYERWEKLEDLKST